jgi:hypothetical protein
MGNPLRLIIVEPARRWDFLGGSLTIAYG